jgi:hypothetical protein
MDLDKIFMARDMRLHNLFHNALAEVSSTCLHPGPGILLSCGSHNMNDYDLLNVLQ